MDILVEGIKKHYDKFDLNCSLEVKKGQITGLVGKNGAGKSTTFKAILGLVKPDAGQVFINGKNALTLLPREKQDIGVVLADSGFSGYLTIQDVAAIMDHFYDKFDRKRFLDQCQEMELPACKQIKEFSTGMKAKLKVMVAMSHEATLLILDEPTSGLDIMARNEILDMLRSYMLKDENSILISSHISGDLESLCDDFYMIDQGNMILHEETDILLSDYAILKVTDEEYGTLEKTYLQRMKKTEYGYQCLTNKKQFYLENAPRIVLEKSGIDDVITMMIQGEKI